MRLIDKMTREEILKLESEDLDRMIMYICATEGIKLLPQPKAPVKPTVEPDLVAYKLDDFYSYTREPLDELAMLFLKHRELLYKESYNYSVGSENKKLERNDYYVDKMTEVKAVKVFSEARYKSVEWELKKYKEDSDAYERDKVEYGKYVKQRDDAAEWVWDMYRTVLENERAYSQLKTAYNEYIKLAENNKEVALTFLKKAYTITPEQEQRLLEQVGTE